MEPIYLAAVDIGGTKITASISSEQGIISKVYQSTKLQGDNTTIPRQVDNLIHHACQQAQIDVKKIHAVGISTASPFIIRGGIRYVVSPNLCGGMVKNRDLGNDWLDIPLEAYLKDKYPRVEMDNDCVVAVIAERTFGAGQGKDNVVYVTWSTGIGMGCIVDGRLIRGKNGNAGHGGHVYVSEDGPLYGYGRGYLESLVAGPALAKDYVPGAKTQDVFEAYAKGDAKAQEVIKRAARNFARGLASVNNLLDSQLFILGGSVFMHNQAILMPLIEEEFYQSFAPLCEGVKIVSSALDQYLGDIAALSLVLPKQWIEKWLDARPWEKAPEPVVL